MELIVMAQIAIIMTVVVAIVDAIEAVILNLIHWIFGAHGRFEHQCCF
jgi:hypothetical protein